MDRDNKPKKKRKAKVWIIILCIVLVLVGSGAVYVYSLLDKVKHTPLLYEDEEPEPETEIKVEEEKKESKPVESKPRELTPEELGVYEELGVNRETGVVNVLLFGLDGEKPGERSRSDSIMIATLDGKNKKIKLTSLMRDTYVPIPGKQDNRINAAYAFGGPALAIRTVNESFNMNIEKYIAIDFFGLEKIIDELGGVDMEIMEYELYHLNGIIDAMNDLNDNKNNSTYVPDYGVQHLDGRQAVAYSRIRKVGNGDFERTDRQRAVLLALADKGKDVSLWELPNILSAVFPEVETNFTKSEILKLGWTGYESIKNDIEELRLPYEGTYEHQRIREMAVLVPNMEKNRVILQDFIYGDQQDDEE